MGNVLPPSGAPQGRDQSPNGKLRAVIESGGQVVGQTIGVAALSAVGPIESTAAGATLGETFSRVGVAVYDATLGRRRSERAAGALVTAYVRASDRVTAGETPRDDGFFGQDENGRVPAHELLEGTLLTASVSYEERKVACLGRMYANIAFDEHVTPEHASFLLRLADRLTYRQLVVLRFVTDANSPRSPMESAIVRLEAVSSAPRPLPDATLLAELDDLSAQGLLGVRQPHGPAALPSEIFGGGAWKASGLVRAALTPMGETLYRLMNLERLPGQDAEDVLTSLGGDLHPL